MLVVYSVLPQLLQQVLVGYAVEDAVGHRFQGELQSGLFDEAHSQQFGTLLLADLQGLDHAYWVFEIFAAFYGHAQDAFAEDQALLCLSLIKDNFVGMGYPP